MTMRVLQQKQEISLARSRLEDRRLSALDSPLKSFGKKWKLISGVPIGDRVKSWDVEAAIEFVMQNLKMDSPIADIGCFSSEVLIALHRAGFSNLTGIDLNPRLTEMPHNKSIRYRVGDFTRTALGAETFEAITAISVIEHGFNPEALLGEMSRLLKANGYFIASFDYWPDKISTEGIKFFDMDWLIFSKEDIARFLEVAARHRLLPIGDLSFAAADRAISCGGKDYTFAYVILRKQG